VGQLTVELDPVAVRRGHARHLVNCAEEFPTLTTSETRRGSRVATSIALSYTCCTSNQIEQEPARTNQPGWTPICLRLVLASTRMTRG